MLNFKLRVTRVTKNRAAMTAVYVFGAAAVLLLASLISAFVVFNLDDPTASVSVAALISLLAAAAVSGFSVAKLAGGDTRSSVITHGIVSALILIASLICGGGFGGFMNAICYMGVAALTALLGKRHRARKKRR